MRFGAAAALGLSETRFGDAQEYLAGARSLAQTGRYPDRTGPYFFRAPGYSAFLAAATLGRPDRLALAKAAGAAAGAVAPLLVAALALRLFGSRRVALAAGLAAAFDPSLVMLSADIQSETIFVPLLLGAGLFLLHAADRPSTSFALASGALLAAAALTRPSALALSPLLAAPLFDRRWPFRARSHLAGAAALGFLFALAPWMARNALRFHEAIPVSDSAGSTFYDGNSRFTLGLYEAKSRAELERRVAEMDARKAAHIASLPPDARRSPSRRSSALIALAVEELRADPAAAGRLYVRKILEWFRPYPSPLFWPWSAVAAVGLVNCALFGLGGLGLAQAHRRGAALFALAFLAAAMAVHVAFLAVWRFRTPYWNPVLLLYGASWAGVRLDQWKRR